MNAILSQVNRILVIFAIHSHLCWISRGNLWIWLIVKSIISRLMPTIWATIVVILLPPLVALSNLAPTMDFVCNSHFVAESRLRHSTSVTCRDMGHWRKDCPPYQRSRQLRCQSQRPARGTEVTVLMISIYFVTLMDNCLLRNNIL